MLGLYSPAPFLDRNYPNASVSNVIGVLTTTKKQAVFPKEIWNGWWKKLKAVTDVVAQADTAGFFFPLSITATNGPQTARVGRALLCSDTKKTGDRWARNTGFVALDNSAFGSVKQQDLRRKRNEEARREKRQAEARHHRIRVVLL
jgi:hypothetical protein